MNNDLIIVLDFGGNQAYYTARRLRGEQFYCEIMPGDTVPEAILLRVPAGIILAGGDDREDALPFEPDSLGVPVLALGGAARMLARRIGATWTSLRLRGAMEFMHLESSRLFDELGDHERFFERADGFEMPEGYESIASLPSGINPAFSRLDGRVFGLQFYVESNDPDGLRILSNFAGEICGCRRSWSVERFAPELIESARRRLGGSEVMIPVTGSMESVVAAALLQRAIGSKLTCVFVDTGLLRSGDPQALRNCFSHDLEIPLNNVDAHERFLKALEGVADAREKRRIVHEEYATVFTEEFVRSGSAERMAEGTTYTDLLRGAPRLIDRMIDGTDPYEPLSALFKEDVRTLGRYLGVPELLLSRPSYEFSGLSVRCLGAVTQERLDMLRRADAIFCEEMERAGLSGHGAISRRAAQYFAVLTDIKTPGANGEGYVCALRALNRSSAGRAVAFRLPYDLMDVLVKRITQEVPGINHLVYDITGRPTASVEWE